MKLHTPSFSVSSIKAPRINKTFVLVSLAVLLVLAVFAYGAVRNQQAKNVQAAHDRDVATQQAKDDKAQADRIKTLEAEVTAANANTGQVCAYVKTLSTNKTFGRQVVLPVQCKSAI
jgi:cell division protein FtsB